VDIKGFTARTSGQSREENQLLLQRFEKLVAPLTRLFGGKVVKSIGDAFLLTFRSPTDALHCAMAIQDWQAELNAQQPSSKRFEVRVAINVGEVRVKGGDVFGEPVNIASRLESLADGGEIFFSEAVYLVMNKSEIPSQELGTRTLKGIPEAVHVYKIPKVSEVGSYRIKGAGASKLKGKVPDNALEPLSLPYGGIALEKVRVQMSKQILDGVGISGLGSRLFGFSTHARRVWEELKGRYRHSGAWRTSAWAFLALVLLVAILGWRHHAHHAKPKPKDVLKNIFG